MTRPNILAVLGVHRKEDVVSNLLAHCFNASEDARRGILHALRLPHTAPFLKSRAYTRVGTGDSGIPDIVLVGCEQTSHVLVVLENKLTAGEGGAQTRRYASPTCRADLIAKFKLNTTMLDVHYRFLTLFPDEKPQSEAFEVVGYDSFIALHGSVPPDSQSWASELMSAWIDILREFYTGGELAPDRKLMAALDAARGLDGSFLLFRRLMESLHLPPGLLLWRTWRGSQPGRRYYLAQFGKNSWAPAKMFQEKAQWRLDPIASFNIHIEPQYSVLAGEFSLYLHYETNPYHPLRWLKDHLHQADYEAYSKRRSLFINKLQTRAPSALRLGGRNNQVGKMSLSLSVATVRAAQDHLTRAIAELASAVDTTLDTINAAGPV